MRPKHINNSAFLGLEEYRLKRNDGD